MKMWQCALCGHVALQKDNTTIRWDDGHSCIFYEQPDPVTTFREMNNAFHEKGLVTQLDSNARYMNLIVWEDGKVLASISEMPNSNRITLITDDGASTPYNLKDRQEIISKVLRLSKVQA